ncbi:MAG: tetratricopeptide repeat protein [Acidiferrobacteraceae bacterium]
MNLAKSVIGLAVCVLAAAGPVRADTPGLATLKDRAESGNVPSENRLGLDYLRGRGIEQNFSKARYWFEKAAAHHGPAAMYNLGLMRLRGLGVRQNEIKAVAWFRKSANMHYVLAEYAMGYVYQNGIGVGKDIRQAKLFYGLAAYAGYRPAVLALIQIRGEQVLRRKDENKGTAPVATRPTDGGL